MTRERRSGPVRYGTVRPGRMESGVGRYSTAGLFGGRTGRYGTAEHTGTVRYNRADHSRVRE